MSDAVLTTATVAARLAMTVQRFYKLRPALAAAGFPPPIQPFNNRWSAAAVQQWIDRQLPAARQGEPTVEARLDEWRDRLRARARGGHAA